MAPQKGETGMGNLKGKSSPLSLAPREESRVNQQKKDAGSTNSLFSSAMTLQLELELPQILGDLHALALDPFHGLERNSPAIIRQFFLRFRSIVYQKSLVLSPPSETEPVEVRATKTTSSFPSENARDSIPSKPGKPLLRPDDPTKAGRKAMPSDRQEEIAAKRLKRINQIKSLAAEKKASQKTLEAPRVEVKEQVASGPSKPVKSDSVKKTVLQARAVQPTMLVMKFPPDTSLPSGPELKAKFGRFGSLDQSAIRVFWKTSTCRVVFRHKVDAEAAYNYAVGNKSLFGNVRVRYSVREAGAPASETPECDKGRGDDFSMETLQFKDTVVERAALAPARSHQPSLQPAVQLKSCLKKPTGEEAGQATGGNGGRGTPRVKFILGGEEITNRGEALMVGNRNNFDNNNASFADGGAPSSSSSSVAMDYNSKNFQKVIPTSTTILPLPLPLQFAKTPLTLPPQFAKTPLNNAHHTEVAPSLPPPPPPPPPRNSHNNLNTASTPSSIDISQQMLSLLTRCNDVVTNVTGLLGYVPYHPL